MTSALVIGGGPAGLMAADALASEGVSVTLCDAKPSVGRKFLMAGKSGLNLTKDEPLAPFMANFFDAEAPLYPIIKAFDAQDVQLWAKELGQEVFTGSSGRVFPRAMKASPLLRAWMARLDALGVRFQTRWRWSGWSEKGHAFHTADGRRDITAGATVLALGGASWARLGSDGQWQDILAQHNVDLAPCAPSNAGLSVQWSDYMTAHFGASLKAVRWRTGDTFSRGEAILSEHGLEGSGVYALTPSLRRGDKLFVDLIPDVSHDKAQAELRRKPEKLRLAPWLKNTLRLTPAKVALFFEMTSGAGLPRDRWVDTVKHLPVRYIGLRPMDEAISTAGGVMWSSLTPELMLKNCPGVFCAGEMLDWEAPTGGYLITASLATGRWAGLSAARYLAAAA